MKGLTQRQLAAILFIAILVGSILVFFLPQLFTDPLIIQRYAVDEENDDGRTFTVEFNEFGYGTEYDND